MRAIHIAAWCALISLIVLIFFGAIVRASGSGLGCPDWPTCWGEVIPPTHRDQIDVTRLDIPKFKRYAARHGIDPDTITRETVLDGFDPAHTWIEFCNRLASTPLALSVLALLLLSFRATRHRALIVSLALISFVDVLVNAWMGAVVVRSGLKPGIITLHMALAFLLLSVLTTVIWRSADPRTRRSVRWGARLRVVSWLFFVGVVVEGILGSQVREQTDRLASSAGALPRSEWIAPLGDTTVFLVHRSFSWVLLLTALGIFLLSRDRNDGRGRPRATVTILVLVLAMMAMGLVLSHVAIFPLVQVLHVGMTAVLLTVTWSWMLDLISGTSGQSAATAAVATAGREAGARPRNDAEVLS